MSQSPRRMLTVPEVAEYLAVHPNTVRKMVRRRELLAVNIRSSGTPVYRVEPAVVDAWVADHRTQPLSPVGRRGAR